MFWIVLTVINVIVTVVNVFILIRYRRSYTLPSKEDILRLKELNTSFDNVNKVGEDYVNFLKKMYE